MILRFWAKFKTGLYDWSSAGSRTMALPLRTMSLGPRTEEAGFTGTIWPTTSQSKRWRTAASRYLTVGADAVVVCPSTQAATCKDLTSVSACTHAPRTTA